MRKLIVLDANILARAVLGERVPNLLDTYRNQVGFFTPATCYGEIRTHLPAIAQKRGLPAEPFFPAIDALSRVVLPVNDDVYGEYEREARRRIQGRDVRDWPPLALALALGCPIWSEDNDFFGTGVATWQTQTIEIYLSDD